jgi:hypothetical protein
MINPPIRRFMMIHDDSCFPGSFQVDSLRNHFVSVSRTTFVHRAMFYRMVGFSIESVDTIRIWQSVLKRFAHHD